MNKILIALAGILAANANAFVLVGPTDPGGIENTLNWGAPNQAVGGANMVDDMGTPKMIDEFYRWNTPNLTYGFDASFVRFFGEQGIAAVSDAMNVLNDFFVPQDCLLYTSPSPRDKRQSRMPSSA